ncbi:MAG: hypothetical protein D6679_11055 [Candidatus Hydrogenedentota bacterium]|nr:MAG: hypothetical protein D6679_11055 [Candidatus Hydrogenedentota bacterium]
MLFSNQQRSRRTYRGGTEKKWKKGMANVVFEKNDIPKRRAPTGREIYKTVKRTFSLGRTSSSPLFILHFPFSVISASP